MRHAIATAEFTTLTLSGGKRGRGHIARSAKLRALLQEAWPFGRHLICTYEPLPAWLVRTLGRDLVRLPVSRWFPESFQLILDRYQPDALLVDNRPEGPRDLLAPLMQSRKWLDNGPALVLVMRDVLDAPNVIREAWRSNGGYDRLRHYRSIISLGDARVFDPIHEYDLQTIRDKVAIIGYLPPSNSEASTTDQDCGLERSILINSSGGADAPWFCDIIAFMEASQLSADSVALCGPFSPSSTLARLDLLEQTGKTRILHDPPNIWNLQRSAKITICGGGYNAVSEALHIESRVIAIPRPGPTLEQIIRIQRLERAGACYYVRDARGPIEHQVSAGLAWAAAAPPSPVLFADSSILKRTILRAL